MGERLWLLASKNKKGRRRLKFELQGAKGANEINEFLWKFKLIFLFGEKKVIKFFLKKSKNQIAFIYIFF